MNLDPAQEATRDKRLRDADVPHGSETSATGGERTCTGYFQDYLERLSTKERLKIQQEIREGYRPALTVRNIINAAQGLQWFSLGEILFIPYSKLKKIAEKYHVDEQCEVAVVRYWMQVDPIVSWRRIIHNLDLFREHSRADRLRHYAEELTDASLSHENVITVLKTADPYNCLYIPASVILLIRDYCKIPKEQINQLVHYWRSVSPYASWSLLAGRLLWLGEKIALEEAKDLSKESQNYNH